MAAFAQSHVNNGIPEIFSSLDYITFQTVLDMVVRNAIDHEKRLKDAFRYIPWLPTSNGSWGFIGKINFTMRPVYHSAYLLRPYIQPFSPRAFQSYLNSELLAHYLDSFIRVIPHDVLVPWSHMADGSYIQVPVNPSFRIPIRSSHYINI